MTTAASASRGGSFATSWCDLDLTRAVEQTAIFLAFSLSQSDVRRYRKTGTQLALQSMLGYLSRAYCCGKFAHVEPDEERSGSLGALWAALQSTRSDQWDFGRAPDQEQWQLEVVMSAVSGRGALLAGHDNGALSAIAGGAPGSFISGQSTDLCADYLVVVTPPGILGRESLSELLAQLELVDRNGNINRRFDVAGFVERLLVGTLDSFRSDSHPPTIASNSNERDFSSKTIHPILQKVSRARIFTGSAVGAGLSALIPDLGVDAYIGVMRRPQAIVLAAAAKSTGGLSLALPVDRKVGKNTDAVSMVHDRTVAWDDDLVPGDDVFVLATAITENLMLRGVRFSQGQATTQTLCLRSRTKSRRIISHTQDVESLVLHLLDSRGQELESPLSPSPRLSVDHDGVNDKWLDDDWVHTALY